VTALLGLATRLKLAKLMLITNARTYSGDLAEFAAAAFAGGVDLIQVREPQADLQVQAAAVATVEKQAGRKGLVSAYGPTEVAAAIHADVVQLSALDGPASEARAALGQWALVGRACHSPAQVDAALADDAVDFFTISPIFNAAGVGEAGLSLVAYAAKVAPPGTAKPWFAVGGVSAENLDQVLAAGARRIGVTRAIAAAADVRAAAADLDDRLTRAWSQDPGMEQAIFGAF
jgi:thiamine-phosphate pyrophosphorylase